MVTSARAPIVQVEIADLHINSKVGLCPPILPQENGSYLATPAQEHIWNNCWRPLFLEAWTIKTELDARLYVVVGGDAGDMNTHDGADLISHNPADEIKAIVYVLSEPREMADEFFVIRGTEAHVGPSASLEEAAAMVLEATPDEEAGTYSWWHLKQENHGTKSDIAHHAATYGWRPWTRQPAASRQSAIIRNDYFEAGERPPDRAVRAHGHYFADSGVAIAPRTYYLPPWQLTTAYGHRRGAGCRIEPIGGLITIFGEGGKWKTLVRCWKQSGRRAWRPTWD